MKTTILLLGLLLTLGIASAQPHTNPPPASKLSGHVRYEIQPLGMRAPYAGKEANEKAKAKIQEYLDAEITPLLEKWNQAAAASGEPQTTLVLSPEILNIKFVSGGKRFWTGMASGSSHVSLSSTAWPTSLRCASSLLER